jgi:hypothetical protein
LTPTGEKLRLPDLFWIDTRITWQLKELTGQRIDVIADVFNLLNRRTPTAVETRNLDDGSFGETTAKLDPLSVQVGLRYRY